MVDEKTALMASHIIERYRLAKDLERQESLRGSIGPCLEMGLCKEFLNRINQIYGTSYSISNEEIISGVKVLSSSKDVRLDSLIQRIAGLYSGALDDAKVCGMLSSSGWEKRAELCNDIVTIINEIYNTTYALSKGDTP